MSFKNSNLSVLAYANGFTLWHYKSSDSITEIRKKNYFKNVFEIVRSGDLIILNTEEEKGLQTSLKIIKTNKNKDITLKKI